MHIKTGSIMIYSQYALFMLRVFGLMQNAAFKYYAATLNSTLTPNGAWSMKETEAGRRRTARTWGHIEVGALFPIHRKTHGSDSCGEIWEQYGIHRSEVAMFTVDEINNKGIIGPGIKLGIHIRDDCWTERTAMEQSIEFIRDAMGRHDTDSRSSSEKCPDNEERKSNLDGFSRNLAAVVGPGSSDPSIAVQNLLQVFRIPQVGYSATTKDLSDKIEFKYYMRVVPSDAWQARALIDLVLYFNWTYIAVVYSAGNYGEKGHEELAKYIDEATGGKLCMAVQEKIKSLAPEEDYDALLKTIMLANPKPQVAVCFCEGATITEVLRATKRFNQKNALAKNTTNTGIQWIGSDSWSDRRDVVYNYEKEAFGGISLKIYSPLVPKFDDYFLKLSPATNKRNPWFIDFWEEKFRCSLRNSTRSLYRKECTGKESLSDNYEQDPKLSQVINSIYTVAYGLSSMYNETCSPWLESMRKSRSKRPSNKSAPYLCPQMHPINGSLLYSHMRRVRFEDFSGQEIYFDEHGDPPARYDILNYQGPIKGYVLIGEWKQFELVGKNSTDNKIQLGTQLTMNTSELIWYNGKSATSYVPQSICSEPCKLGEIKKIQQLQQCCWTCIPCQEDQYVFDEKTCKSCALGFWPNANRSGCYELNVEYMRWNSAEALVSIVLACLGILVTCFTTLVFARFNSTPVVKSTTRELSYIILFGFLLCYSTTFAIVLKPNAVTCHFLRIVPGVAFSMIYGALLTKTNRIARILAGSKKRILTKKPRFMSTGSQLAITALIVGIEAGIIAAILVYEPATAQHDYNLPRRVLLVCKTTTLSFFAPYGFDFLLVSSCTFYAIKTRNLPENFNEAKFIGFTMYTTCVIWLAFCTIYFGSHSKGTTMSISFTLSATVALVLLFLPKMYIIIFKPERNVRSSYATTKVIRCHFGGGGNRAIDERSSRSFSISRTASSNRPSAVSRHSNPRSATDSGIELNSVKQKRAQIRDPLHPTASFSSSADTEAQFKAAASTASSAGTTPILKQRNVAGGISGSQPIADSAGQKIARFTAEGQIEAPPKNAAAAQQRASQKSSSAQQSNNYLSQLCRSLAGGAAPSAASRHPPHQRSTTFDFEPNELSTIEESLMSHEESSVGTAKSSLAGFNANGANTADSKNNLLEGDERRAATAEAGDEETAAERSSLEIEGQSSTLVSEACQTDLELVMSLLDARLLEQASKKSATVADSSQRRESRRRSRQKSLMHALLDYSDDLLPADDSYESLLATRLKCMELEERKLLEKQRSLSNASAEKPPKFAKTSIASADRASTRRTSDPEPTFHWLAHKESSTNPVRTAKQTIRKRVKKRRSELGLTDLLAKGIEGSLQAVLGTAVGSGVTVVEYPQSGRVDKLAEEVPSKSARKKSSTETKSVDTSVGAVAAVIYPMLKMTDQTPTSEDKNDQSSDDASNAFTPSSGSMSSAASKCSSHSASSSMFSRVSDSLRRSLRRLGRRSSIVGDKHRVHSLKGAENIRRRYDSSSHDESSLKLYVDPRARPCFDDVANAPTAPDESAGPAAAGRARFYRNLAYATTMSSTDNSPVVDAPQQGVRRQNQAAGETYGWLSAKDWAADSGLGETKGEKYLPLSDGSNDEFFKERKNEEDNDDDFELASIFNSRGMKAKELSHSTIV